MAGNDTQQKAGFHTFVKVYLSLCRPDIIATDNEHFVLSYAPRQGDQLDIALMQDMLERLPAALKAAEFGEFTMSTMSSDDIETPLPEPAKAQIPEKFYLICPENKHGGTKYIKEMFIAALKKQAEMKFLTEKFEDEENEQEGKN
jgi:hypothetical protein